MDTNDNITFTIHQVAKMLGISPTTIRNWEKKGLIVSRRSSNNYRIFTIDDIELLKKVKEYSIDKHMGTHAIKMLLPVSSDTDIESYVEQQKENYYSQKLISEKWREIRKQQGYTLEEVSRAVGISVAHLSKLENGGNVSLDMMNRLAHFYRESPLYFMNSSQEEKRLVRKGTGEPIQLKNDRSQKRLRIFSSPSMDSQTLTRTKCWKPGTLWLTFSKRPSTARWK